MSTGPISSIDEAQLGRLLDYLAARPEAGSWQGWRVEPIAGGHNALLYRVTGWEQELAVKFTPRDDRRRAWREYSALAALREVGLELAPLPLLLDESRLPYPALIQSWISGKVSEVPPRNEQEWRHLLDHLVAIHALTPDRLARPLPRAVLFCRSADDGRLRLKQRFDSLPPAACPVELQELVRRVEGTRFPSWPEPQLTLCRVDPNLLNFIRQPDRWLSVDWENSGWGDPAMEVADLMAHPTYQGLPTTEWEGIVGRYCALRGDPALARRIGVYYALTLAWWAVTFAGHLHNSRTGRGKSRLVQRSAEWTRRLPLSYTQYLERAHQVLDRPAW